MSSEVEKMARAHADERCPGQDDCDIVYSMCADDFKAGYAQAVKDAEAFEPKNVPDMSEFGQGYRVALSEIRRFLQERCGE